MSKRTVTIRLSEASEKQIEELGKYGGITNVIAVAVDRLWCEEIKGKEQKQ
jgi:hypothetical protein